MRTIRRTHHRWRALLVPLLLSQVALLALAAQAGAARAGDALSTEDRVTLQATMAQYIEQHLIGDAFMHVDPRTGKVEKLYPVWQHPMIVRLDQIVVLCAELRRQDGKMVNADFYATRDDGRFVIFQAEIENREPLQALLMKGAASLLQ